jgi:OmpA-OmpF porin, OOP family
MKKIYFTILLLLSVIGLNAQTKTDKAYYNKLSFEVGAGFNRFYEYNNLQPKPSLFTVDLGLRYMFNPKFGIKGDVGYNSLLVNEESNVRTKYYRLGLEGVMNVGRIANFETWTSRIGLLVHLGAGYSQLRYVADASIVDHVLNVKAGVTVQLKLSERIALFGDVSTIPSYSHDFTYDGITSVPNSSRMGMLNGTGGLVFYLDENEKHMDWVSEQEDNTEVIELRNKIEVLNQSLNDTDRDGVLDSLDLEPNTVAGVTVDSRGRSIDTNNNGVSDEIEKQFKTFGSTETPAGLDAKSLIDNGYVSVYFDFNKTFPTEASYDKIDFVLNYLKTNPNSSVDVTGYADEIGNELYNLKLSESRANTVKDILIKSGINENRITVLQGGVDNSVDKNSPEARKLVRKVVFKLK